MKVYFGFGLADSMFPQNCTIQRRELSDAETKEFIEAGVESCLNPSHIATVQVMEKRGFQVEVKETAPIVKLVPGDKLIVFGVSGLPRLQNRHEYSAEEVQQAKFRVGLYSIQ